jgi:hypothetical protein
MPNHCETDLTISGPADLVDKCLDQYFTPTSYELDCDKVIPYPTQYREMDRIAHEWEDTQKAKGLSPWDGRPTDGFNSGGYDWCCTNWGTKWGTYEGRGLRVMYNTNSGRRKIKLSFTSAWSPPIPVFYALCQMFPELNFVARSFESGGAWSSMTSFRRGRVVLDKANKNYRGRRGG